MDTEVLKHISAGVFLVATRNQQGKLNGQIVNTVMQVANDPVNIIVSISKENLTHGWIIKTGCFAVSILAQATPMKLIGHFGFKSGRQIDKFRQWHYKTTEKGLPYLIDYATSFFEAQLKKILDSGSHSVFLATVTGMKMLKGGIPLTYSYYQKEKKGKVPKTAPTYSEDVGGIG